MCARGNLQKTSDDTYTATLASRIFWAMMAIIAAFDYETQQYDAVNAYANAKLQRPTCIYTHKG